MATRRPGARALPAVTGALLVAVLTACTAETPGRASGDPAAPSAPSAIASATASRAATTPTPGGPTAPVPATTVPPTVAAPPTTTGPPGATPKPSPGLVVVVGRIAVGPDRRCMLLRAEPRTFQLVGPYAGELVPGLSVEVVGTVERGVRAVCGSAVPLRILRIRPAP